MVFSLILIGLLALFIGEKIVTKKDKNIKLTYSLSKKEVDEKGTHFVFQSKNVGKNKIQIHFISNLEYDVSIERKDGEIVSGDGTLIINELSNVKDGRTVYLSPENTLKSSFIVKTNELPEGEYLVTVQLSADNIKTIPVTEEFTVK